MQKRMLAVAVCFALLRATPTHAAVTTVDFSVDYGKNPLNYNEPAPWGLSMTTPVIPGSFKVNDATGKMTDLSFVVGRRSFKLGELHVYWIYLSGDDVTNFGIVGPV